MRQTTEQARPGAPSARDRGLRGATYGPASPGRRLSRQELEAYAQEHGDRVSGPKPKPKKYASASRARVAKQRARKRAAGLWEKYG